jgi:hypothetical protein
MRDSIASMESANETSVKAVNTNIIETYALCDT